MSIIGFVFLGVMASMLAGTMLGIALWPRDRRKQDDVMQQIHGDQPRLLQ